MAPKVGDVLLRESWLRHEVPLNMAEGERVSVSLKLWVVVASPSEDSGAAQRWKPSLGRTRLQVK